MCRLIILRSVYIAGSLIPPSDVLENLRTGRPEAEFREIVAVCQGHFDRLWSLIDRSPFSNELSLDEHTLIATPVEKITLRQLTDAFWRIESSQALMWCLGMIDALPPYDARANEEIFKSPAFQDYDQLLRDARLRPEAEINSARDEAELWHWRSRTRELIESGSYPPSHPMFKDQPYDTLDGVVRLVAQKLACETPPKPTIDEDFPANGKAYRDLTNDEWCDVRSITIERHLALNWVCGYGENNRWELTPTGT